MCSGTLALRVAIQHCVWPRGLPTMIKCDEPIGMTLHSEQLPHRTRAMPRWQVTALLCSLMVMLNRGCAINGGASDSEMSALSVGARHPQVVVRVELISVTVVDDLRALQMRPPRRTRSHVEGVSGAIDDEDITLLLHLKVSATASRANSAIDIAEWWSLSVQNGRVFTKQSDGSIREAAARPGAELGPDLWSRRERASVNGLPRTWFVSQGADGSTSTDEVCIGVACDEATVERVELLVSRPQLNDKPALTGATEAEIIKHAPPFETWRFESLSPMVRLVRPAAELTPQ